MSIKPQKKEEFKFPRKIIIIPNRDKDSWTEKWTDIKNRDPLNIPCSWRLLMAGKPGSGKGMILKNIILRSAFDEIVVIHPDVPEINENNEKSGTLEWEEIEPDAYFKQTELPPLNYFSGINKKTLIILDDINMNMNKEDKRLINRYLGYLSTHKRCCIALLTQNFSDCPISWRRMMNVFCLWKLPSKRYSKFLAERTGIKNLEYYFGLCKTYHDFIMLDLTIGSPYPVRLNGYEILK